MAVQDSTPEVWRDIPGFEGRYQVSDAGRVRGLLAPRGPRRVPRVMSPEVEDGGRRAVTLSVGGVNQRHRVARLVLMAFRGPSDGRQALHADDDPTNDALANLRWGTRLENADDAARNGKIQRGERRPNAKLCAAAVRVIRSSTGSLASLARRFHVSTAAIRNARDGLTWAHVK